MTHSKIYFELDKNKTYVKIMRNGKQIGQVYSDQSGKDDGYGLPYPHDKDKDYCKNSIQVCGFDTQSEVWACGPFQGRLDTVFRFIDYDGEWEKEQIEQYKQYVKSFMEAKLHEYKDGLGDTHKHPVIEFKEGIDQLKSFREWVSHGFPKEHSDRNRLRPQEDEDGKRD